MVRSNPLGTENHHLWASHKFSIDAIRPPPPCDPLTVAAPPFSPRVHVHATRLAVGLKEKSATSWRDAPRGFMGELPKLLSAANLCNPARGLGFAEFRAFFWLRSNELGDDACLSAFIRLRYHLCHLTGACVYGVVHLMLLDCGSLCKHIRIIKEIFGSMYRMWEKYMKFSITALSVSIDDNVCFEFKPAFALNYYNGFYFA